MTRPILTLYIYKRKGKAVAIAVGEFPPDPCLAYDALIRIPIVSNGDRPRWRAFTWYAKETMGAALKRSRWPDDPKPMEEYEDVAWLELEVIT